MSLGPYISQTSQPPGLLSLLQRQLLRRFLAIFGAAALFERTIMTDGAYLSGLVPMLEKFPVERCHLGGFIQHRHMPALF